MSRLVTVALVARDAGVHVLRDALLSRSGIEMAAVFTHSRLPKAEGGGVRPEFDEIERLCRVHGAPVKPLEFPEARDIERYLPDRPLDVLVSVSWRYRVSPGALARFRFGGINLHRGALPAYAGAEPVRRALAAGESRVAITAHRMAEAIDTGPVLAQVWLDVGPAAGDPPPAFVDAVKSRLLPLYAPLAGTALAAAAASPLAGA